jgi:hypothetical protein
VTPAFRSAETAPEGGLAAIDQPLAGAIVATSSSGARFDGAVGADGVFAFKLPPGEYRVHGYSTGFGNGTHCARASVTVTLGAVTPADVVCNVR